MIKNYTFIIFFVLYSLGINATNPVNKILVTSIKNVGELDNSVSITCTLFNLGRKSITLNENLEPNSVDFQFEESFSRSKLLCYKNKIIELLLKSNLELKRGKMVKAVPLKLPMMQEFAHENTKKKHKRRRIRHSSDTNVMLASTKTREKKHKRRRKHEDYEQGFSVNQGIENSKNSHHLKDVCVDIVIDTILVKKRTKNYITIEYTLSNQGKASADLYGEPYDESDNLALKVFLGRSENITRGSIPMGGTFIEKGIKHGILKVGEKYTNTLKLSTKDLTKFTPFLIMKVDPFNVMNECHRRNNDKAIKVKVK